MNKTYQMYVIGAALFAVVVAGIWWMQTRPSPSSPAAEPTATTTTSAPLAATTSTATNATTNPSTQPATQKPATVQASAPGSAQAAAPATPSQPFAIVQGDTIASWNFTGSYKDGGQLEASRNAIIADMKQKLSAGAPNTYELNISIANQYELLGDGQNEYRYLQYALALDSTQTALAWHNMGKLLEKLGAYKSARVAYDRMIHVQLTKQYALARLEFLKAHMPEDTNAIAQAEADMSAATW